MKLNLKLNLVTIKKNQRLHNCPVPLIGLTGGIASGKTTVSNLLKKKEIQVICADQLVKKIYAEKASLSWIDNHFKDCIKDNQIDFKLLRKEVFLNSKNKEKLESFIYPQLGNMFKKEMSLIIKKNKQNFIIYDVPLLFEKKYQENFDQIVCIYSSHEIQKKRLVLRDNITQELALIMIKSQMDIEEKKRKSNFIINNTSTQEELKKNTVLFINKIIN